MPEFSVIIIANGLDVSVSILARERGDCLFIKFVRIVSLMNNYYYRNNNN